MTTKIEIFIIIMLFSLYYSMSIQKKVLSSITSLSSSISNQERSQLLLFLNSNSSFILHSITNGDSMRYLTNIALSSNCTFTVNITKSNRDGTMKFGFLSSSSISSSTTFTSMKNIYASAGGTLNFKCNINSCSLNITTATRNYTNILFSLQTGVKFFYVEIKNLNEGVNITNFNDFTQSSPSPLAENYLFNENSQKEIIQVNSTFKRYFFNQFLPQNKNVSINLSILNSYSDGKMNFGFIACKNASTTVVINNPIVNTGNIIRISCSDEVCLLNIIDINGNLIVDNILYSFSNFITNGFLNLLFFIDISNSNESVKIEDKLNIQMINNSITNNMDFLTFLKTNSSIAMNNNSKLEIFVSNYVGLNSTFQLYGHNISTNGEAMFGIKNIADPYEIKSGGFSNWYMNSGDIVYFSCVNSKVYVKLPRVTNYMVLDLLNSENTNILVFFIYLPTGNKVEIINYISYQQIDIPISFTNPFDLYGVLSEAEKENVKISVLDTHNFYRAKHLSPLMTRDSHLDKTAQAYADLLAQSCSLSTFDHSSISQRTYIDGSIEGENMCLSTGMRRKGEEYVKSYYDEIIDYDFNSPGFYPEAGHFTQLIWIDSTKLGTGLQRCYNIEYDTEIIFIVNHYHSVGNVIGYFPQNVLPLIGVN